MNPFFNFRNLSINLSHVLVIDWEYGLQLDASGEYLCAKVIMTNAATELHNEYDIDDVDYNRLRLHLGMNRIDSYNETYGDR